MKPVAFLGLGIMGSRMSRRLLEAGYPLTVWNRTAKKTEGLRHRGAKEASSPKEAASDAAFILTMLADPLSVRRTVLGPDGVIEGIRPGAVLIDLTTVDPQTPQDLQTAIGGKGAFFLEAPVTGSKPAAESGELVLMVGGAGEILDQARPVLRPLCKAIVHMGPVGTGARMKLINNLIIAGSMQALFEGLTLGRKGGVPTDRMLEVLASGALSSVLLRMKGKAVMDRDFEPNFSVKHMAKDLRLALEEARRLGVSLTQSAGLNALYESALHQGFGEEDFSALVKITEKMSGVERS